MPEYGDGFPRRVRIETHPLLELILKLTVPLLLAILFSGCVSDSPIVHRDDTVRVRQLSEKKAHTELSCEKAVAGRSVRSVRMTDWGNPLFAEYRVWVEGCGKHVTYVLVCQEDDDEEDETCRFSDAMDVRDE